ncbi:hypothetical protein ASPCADRAFT_508597 [Aspergillus carbonarius ITEM 5010]|uniref:Uncharacterized protein n=1 Tax=Aspergillus carbonarius (strain ITEM 5010) TaxID=602072 RepID=A0A1R3RG56_ASPC5|nr:hypothetical protein ASPCADRAFT_508597 [Aspergillus carbonarius ITEM 5010]
MYVCHRQTSQRRSGEDAAKLGAAKYLPTVSHEMVAVDDCSVKVVGKYGVVRGSTDSLLRASELCCLECIPTFLSARSVTKTRESVVPSRAPTSICHPRAGSPSFFKDSGITRVEPVSLPCLWGCSSSYLGTRLKLDRSLPGNERPE